MLGLVTTLLNDPLFFTWIQVSFESLVILTNHSLDWVKVTISNIVGSFRNTTRTLNIICYQSKAIWSQTLQDFCIKWAIFICAVLPRFNGFLLCVNIFEVVIEKIFALNKFSSVPFSNVTTLKRIKIIKTYTIRIDQGSFSMKFSLSKVSFIYDAVGEFMFSYAILPLIFLGAFVCASTPLWHFTIII